MKFFALPSVVQGDIKATRHRNNDLMQILVSMRPAIGTAWNIVGVINPLDIEWDVIAPLDEGKIASRVRDRW